MNAIEAVNAARRLFELKGTLEIKAVVHSGTGGCWVEARVFVKDDDVEPEDHEPPEKKEELPEDAFDFMENKHSTSCYVENVNNQDRDQFWVCSPGCPVLSERNVIKRQRKVKAAGGDPTCRHCLGMPDHPCERHAKR